MYLILHSNSDPFCGGDFTFCKTKKELMDNITFCGYIFGIYNLNDKRDIKRYFLKERY